MYNSISMEEEVKLSGKAYCLVCSKKDKEKREIVDPEVKKTKHNHLRMTGKCKDCGRKVSTFIKPEKKEEEEKQVEA